MQKSVYFVHKDHIYFLLFIYNFLLLVFVLQILLVSVYTVNHEYSYVLSLFHML